jgi:phage gpG-like protein
VQSCNTEHGPDYAEVGTNLNYAKFHILGAELVPLFHQKGVWILPKRDPFDIDVNEAVERAAQEVVEAIARST